MKRTVIFLLAVVAGISIQAAEGALGGKFSVSRSSQVVFAQGNLQYNAAQDTWRFAGQQYEYIGQGNENIAASYDGWIDLFGWGTGNNPTLATLSDADYKTFSDWGANAVSNGGNTAGLWRTLSKDEWVYMIQTRAKASSLFGLGSIDGVNGMILLPDNWHAPEGISFTPSTTKGLQDLGIHFDNEGKDNYSHNTFTQEQWAQMETAGAVFLPAAGGRFGEATTYLVGENGHYWTSTAYDSYFSHLMYFDSEFLFPQAWSGCYRGFSVRLVTTATDTGLEDTTDSNDRMNSQKTLRDGQLLILRDGKTYNITGQEVK